MTTKEELNGLSDQELIEKLRLYQSLQSKGLYDEIMILLLELEMFNRKLEI